MPGQEFSVGEHGTRTPVLPSGAQGCSSSAPSRDAARGFTTQTPRSPVKQPWHEGIFHFFHIFSAYFEDLEVIQFLEQEGVPAVASLGGTEALPTPSPGTSPRRHLNEPHGSV